MLHNNKIYDKPKSIQEAKRHLKELSNKTHSLISGTVISKKNKIIWRHTCISRMTMHKLTNKEIDEAKRIFSKMGWPTIDTTRRSVEETAAAIMSIRAQK